MAEEVQLPALGESVTEGIITQWLVAVGDTVEVDQPLVEISTDKVDTEIPSPVAGVVQSLNGAVDDTIEIGHVIAVIGGEGAAPAAPAAPAETPAAAAPPAPTPAPAPAAAVAPAAASGPTNAPSGRRDRGDNEFDVVIVGAGTGGYSTALRASALGLHVAIVEKAKVGGTCLHWGCIPTKAILQTAEIAEHAKDAASYGVKASYDGIEVAALNAHKDDVVDKMWKGLQGALKHAKVETIAGTATFTSATSVSVELAEGGTRVVTGASLVVATGAQPRELPFAKFDGTKIISSDHALHLQELPTSAIILGSGAVGMEFATAWNAFGVDVTIVELEDRLLPLEDADVSKEMGKQYRKAGITALTGVKMTSVETTDTGVACMIEGGKGGDQIVEADILLVAVGRKPVVDALGLEEIGVTVERGFVKVDEYCRTAVQGVYALGDVIDTLGLAHASFAEGFLVSDQLAGEDVMPIDYRGVPKVTYSHPEVGSVGYTEKDAKDSGFDVVIQKYSFQALARAQMMKATGMVKLVAEKDESQPNGAGRILGVHLVGPKATDLIAEGELIYNWEALPMDVARFIHAHPSLSEAIGEAHMALAGRALH
ncbi:MAG: dihydrolipoamide dehydrogenase [Nitriliruptoraceae bacterium]